MPGPASRWGHDGMHCPYCRYCRYCPYCPYCHGWKIRDQPIGVLATGPLAVRQPLLSRQWTARLTLLLHTAPAPTAEEDEQPAARRPPPVASRWSAAR
ncbi:hypothetical protein [Streptomyces sp. SID3343]|uniref:hypothetical protein n=1 Tax=Streptomyces sp. SID3343 TaxID=2690260 RepID=UPI001F358135